LSFCLKRDKEILTMFIPYSDLVVFNVPQMQHIVESKIIGTNGVSNPVSGFKQLGIEEEIKNINSFSLADSKQSTSLPSPGIILNRAEAIRDRYGLNITINYNYDLYRNNRAYENLIDRLVRPGINTSSGNQRIGTDRSVLVEQSIFSDKPIIHIPLSIISQPNVLSAMRQNNPKVMKYLDELQENNLNDEEMLIMFRTIKNILDSNRRVLIYLPSAEYRGGLLNSAGDDVSFLRKRFENFIDTLIINPIQRDMIDFTIEIGDKALLRDNNLEPVSREDGRVIVSPTYFKNSR